jgi:hypothetical protein
MSRFTIRCACSHKKATTLKSPVLPANSCSNSNGSCPNIVFATKIATTSSMTIPVLSYNEPYTPSAPNRKIQTTAPYLLLQFDLVEQYEAISGFHIVISKSGWNARTYICKSHVDCCFRAKFGPSRGKESIVLKATISYDFHCGENIVGPFYRRMKCKIRRSVDNVTLVKDENPKPKDVMKVAANIDFITTTYHQSYRAIDRITSETNVKNLRSFQLIMPYTKKFLDKG